jgi:hypothetical protein
LSEFIECQHNQIFYKPAYLQMTSRTSLQPDAR